MERARREKQEAGRTRRNLDSSRGAVVQHLTERVGFLFLIVALSGSVWLNREGTRHSSVIAEATSVFSLGIAVPQSSLRLPRELEPRRIPVYNQNCSKHTDDSRRHRYYRRGTDYLQKNYRDGGNNGRRRELPGSSNIVCPSRSRPRTSDALQPLRQRLLCLAIPNSNSACAHYNAAPSHTTPASLLADFFLRLQRDGGPIAMGTVGWAKKHVLPISLCGIPITAVYLGKRILDTPMRSYKAGSSVADAYDQWTDDGIVEHYWGDHIHLGYYTDAQQKQGSFRADFKQAKNTFVQRLMEFGQLPTVDEINKDLEGRSGAKTTTDEGNPAERITPSRSNQNAVFVPWRRSPQNGKMQVLDVGCGIGGSSRLLATQLASDALVTGITLSQKQVDRARELTQTMGLSDKCHFMVMDAQTMSFPDDTFDVVWVCESTEHMPDKDKFIREISRVTKPGGRVIVAVWSQRDHRLARFTSAERKMLNFLYKHWSHPPFISINEFTEKLTKTGVWEDVKSADWTRPTLPSWHHQMYLGITDPLPWILRPWLYSRTVRDAWCMHRMHQAFKSGLMQYGVICAVKKKH